MGTSSCIRFRIRRKVDFPQPDGPISAVTFPSSMVREIRSSTLLEPNQALDAGGLQTSTPYKRVPTLDVVAPTTGPKCAAR